MNYDLIENEDEKSIGPLILNYKSRKTCKQFLSNLNEITDRILYQYPDGLKSIIKTPCPSDDDVASVLILNCTETFISSYANAVSKLNNNQLQFQSQSAILQKDTHDLDLNAINQRVIEYTKKYTLYTDYLHGVFENFEESFESIIDLVITDYTTQLANHQKNENSAYYEKANQLFRQLYNNHERQYVEIDYEDFIVIFCSLIKYYSGLNISLKLIEANKELMLFIYGSQESYNNIAEFFEYELQLKPYAMEYNRQSANQQASTINYSNTINNSNVNDTTLNEPLLPKSSFLNSTQFEALDIDNPSDWPPYVSFKLDKSDKYRLYCHDDDYYDDYIIQDKTAKLDIASKFRSIDKLRLSYLMLDYFLKFSYMHQHKIIHHLIFKKNFKPYKHKMLSSKFKNDVYHIFAPSKCMSVINIIRNYYGEIVSFYFLWLNFYCKWLLFPGVIGILITLLYYSKQRVAFISIFNGKIRLDDYDFGLIAFCILISLWASLFLNIWNQKERLYSFIWGMENVEKYNPVNERFVPDSKEVLIFGYQCPQGNSTWHKFKMYVSYCMLTLMVFLVCFIVYLLFRFKAGYINGDMMHDYKVSIIIASINGLQIKAMNYVYYYVAKYLNDWENHEKLSDKHTSLASKLILFDFVNSYSALFYIAFIKPYNEGCIGNNCLKEIEMQLYTIFFIYLGLYIIELAWLKYRQMQKVAHIMHLSENDKIIVQTIEHQLICEGQKTLMYEYNTLVIQFGFVCLFSVAAPLTPILVFVLVYVSRLADYYKFIHLVRIDFLQGAKGIHNYNYIMRLMGFIGMMVNVAIVLFSSPNFAKKDLSYNELEHKIIVFAMVENLVLILMYCLNWNSLPDWFCYLDVIKELYQKKFYYKDSNELNKNNNYLNN